MIADIIINTTAKRLQQTFSYVVPPDMPVHVGNRVCVPFGRRQEEGIVVSVSQTDRQDLPYELKPIRAVLSSQAGFQEEMIATAYWISQYYLCTFSDALRLFMIEKKGLTSCTYITAGSHQPSSPEEQLIFDYVRNKNEAEKQSVLRKFGADRIAHLIAKGVLEEKKDWKKKISDKKEKWISFVHTDEEGILARRPRQAALLGELEKKGSLSMSACIAKGYSADVVRHLCATGLAAVVEKNAQTKELLPCLGDRSQPFALTAEQQHAVQVIQHDTEGRTYVLHGITGSGKTEVYMQLASHVLQEGKQVIVLVPEIALTGQIVQQFIRRFGNDIVVMHSQLSKGERKNNWLRMLHGESHICIGARSAIFTAAQHIGLIIVDEAHDSSYKQEESPRYHAVAVAQKRAAYYHCPVILGSATPSVSDYYRALNGTYTLLELKKRVHGQSLPSVAIADMRDELARGNYRVISDAMAALLEETLQAKQQAIILLNRRGFSTFVMCRKCGYVVKCDTCDVPMVYHKQSQHLQCHYCEATKPIPTVCPSCGSKYIKFFGTGTEKVEEQLKELFPSSRIVRLDQDTTSRKYSGERILEQFRRHEYDILLGTQMVAKGHDFMNVSAVGILSADSLLNLPAYWAGERTFQLLTQAAGRAGRGKIPGKVIMQTYAPEHYVIQCAQKQDYCAFYDQEIEFRRALAYPPFTHIIKIILADEQEQVVWKKGNDLAAALQSWARQSQSTVEIIGPFADVIKKIRSKYRLIILIKGEDVDGIKAYMRQEAMFWERGIIIDVDPSF